MKKVFGIGWAKTGTSTLGACFRILGYRHQGQRLELVDDVKRGEMGRILAIAAEKDTFEDWPWIVLYRQLDEAFPESSFVLTTRNPASWLPSYRNMLKRESPPTAELRARRQVLYGFPVETATDAQLVERFERHSRDVREYFANRPESLLTLDWQAGDDWKQLCDFLGVETPDVPLPHANRGTYTTGRLRSNRLWSRILRRIWS